MAMQPRQLSNRWRAPILANDWEAARSQVADALRDLQRIFGIIHSAVEYPSATVSSRVSATGNTTINSNAYVDLTGATTTIMLDVSSTLWIEATFTLTCTTFGAITDLFNGSVDINGGIASPAATTGVSAVNDTRSVTMVFLATVKSGTNYTVKLRAKQGAGASTYTALSGLCHFTYLTIPNVYQVP